MSTMDLSKLKSPVMWPGMRQHVVQAVGEVIGPMNRDKLDLQLKTVDEVEFRGYVRKRVNYFVDAWDRISAWLFIPEGKDEAPAILCCHSQSPGGKGEPAGLEGDSHLAFQMKKMHVHAKVLRDGEVVGAFRTETSSTCVDGEIATFNIARVLGCGELFQPTAPMELRGKGLATLRQLMAEAKFPAAKEADRQGVLEEIANNPDGLRGGFRKC